MKSITDEEDVPETIAPKEYKTAENLQNGKTAENQNGFDRLINDRKKSKKGKKDDDPFANHKPITEVLHDIYDKNIQ